MQIERCVISTFQVAESLGFNGATFAPGSTWCGVTSENQATIRLIGRCRLAPVFLRMHGYSVIVNGVIALIGSLSEDFDDVRVMTRGFCDMLSELYDRTYGAE